MRPTMGKMHPCVGLSPGFAGRPPPLRAFLAGGLRPPPKGGGAGPPLRRRSGRVAAPPPIKCSTGQIWPIGGLCCTGAGDGLRPALPVPLRSATRVPRPARRGCPRLTCQPSVQCWRCWSPMAVQGRCLWPLRGQALSVTAPFLARPPITVARNGTTY